MSRGKSLKTRILTFLGALVVVLMMIISISVLYRWRALILDSERRSALAVAQTFSVSILDALIYQEGGLLQNEGFLESHIHNFVTRNRQVKFVVLYDQRGQVILRSSYAGDDPRAEELKFPPNAEQPITHLYQSRTFGWILEVTQPLQIHSKSWGALKIGFDIEPTRKKLDQLFYLLLGLTIGFVFILLTVIYFLVHRLTQSLSQLVAEMNHFDLDHIHPTQMKAGDDEIGSLVENFEKMKGRLSQSRQQLLDAQRQILHAEKLASIGRLASGVAHEINNPLHGLKNCLFLIGREAENPAKVREVLGLADESVDHIATIVQKLLNFSRPKAKEIAKIDLHEDIAKVLALLGYRLEKGGITIEQDLDPALPLIHADSQLLQEVIMNLLLNSFDSLENGGTIRLTTRRSGENTIRLSIADTGCGIDPEHLDKIFDPFFTTKEEGKGTGLGLSVSLGIIEAHGGTISVISQPRAGTTFTVTLPIEGNL